MFCVFLCPFFFFFFLKRSAHLIRDGILHVNTCGFEWVRIGCISLVMRHKNTLSLGVFTDGGQKEAPRNAMKNKNIPAVSADFFSDLFRFDSNPHNRSAIHLYSSKYTHTFWMVQTLEWRLFFFSFFQTEAWSLMRNNWSDLRYAFKSTFQVMG